MDEFEEYLVTIENKEHRARMEEVLAWVAAKYPGLETRIAWNQPMFTDHGTFIIGFSVSGKNLAIAPEVPAINRFSDEIVKAGYDHTKGLLRIRWDLAVDFSLLERLIEFNIMDKADCSTFWRK
ncbi:MAG: iron chaperone [Eubacteriales bacterium]